MDTKLYVIFTTFVLITSAPNTNINKEWNINFNEDPTDPSKYYGEWKNHNYFPSPQDWRNESIYQFVTDRFADGNPENNEGKYGGYDLNKISTRHGGDFKGIQNKLDYIKSLGFTSIWLSPIFQNRKNSYHGYAQIDFTILDDRFGKLAELRELVEEAHKRDIKVIIDIVVNHMDDLFYFEGHKDERAPFKFHNGEYNLVWKQQDEQYADFKINNTFYEEGQYTDVYNDSGELIKDSGVGSYWLSDFHHNGDLNNYGDIWENILGKIYGIMDDLRTSHPRVERKITAMSKALIASTDIDGFRVDTPMQVPLTFFKSWIPQIKEYAKSLGKSNFFVFGEFYCSKERASTMTGRGKTPLMYSENKYIDETAAFDSGIHYPMYLWFNQAIKEQKHGVRDIYDLFKKDIFDYDWFNPSTQRYEYRNLNFFNNHDQWRMSSSENGLQKTNLCTAIIAFWPGIPLFYYGDEQGLRTDQTALDGYSREDFMTSLAWKNYRINKEPNAADKDNFNMTNKHFLWVQKIVNIRNIYSVLKTCDNIEERWIQTNSSNGIFIYERKCENKKVLIAFNTWKDSLVASNVKIYWDQGEKIINVINPKETQNLNTNSEIDYITFNGFEVKAFLPIKDYEPLNPTIIETYPNHDEVISKKSFNETITIKISFSEPILESSLESNIFFNDKKITKASINIDKNSIFIDAIPQDGVNFIKITSNVKSSITNKSLIGNFQSRFRYGDSDNIILDNSNRLRTNIIQSIEGDTIRVNHFANGAELYRFKYQMRTEAMNESQKWSEWKKYEKNTVESLNAAILRNVKSIIIQYYVDNSAAYFIEQELHNLYYE